MLFFNKLVIHLTHIVSWLFQWFIPPMRKRIIFEYKNRLDPLCESFFKNNIQAEAGFFFSSEGEWQQVLPLVEAYLLKNRRIELIFFSPSVESAIVKISHLYPNLIRYRRFELLTGGNFPTDWLTAKKVFQVRYDFFPQMLCWKLQTHHKWILLWASLKKIRQANSSPSKWQQMFYQQFDEIWCATPKDYDSFLKLNLKASLQILDLRFISIQKRINNLSELLQQDTFKRVVTFIESASKTKRIILGNIWQEDLFLLQNSSAPDCLLIVPHSLESHNLSKILQITKEHFPQAILIDHSNIQNITTSNVVILNVKGLLCELYAFFDYAYVGGGFGKSVHSLLEPWIAGCQYISCGPKVTRSTEFDWLKPTVNSKILNSSMKLNDLFVEVQVDDGRKQIISQMIQRYEQLKESL